MIVLVFVACMSSSPDVCKEQNLLFSEQVSPMTCLMQAQLRLAEWTVQHPRWRIGSWRCGTPDQLGSEA